MTSTRTVVFYISGHGFGHASRQIEIVNALAARDPGIRIRICTWATPWLFDLTLRAFAHVEPVSCDTGVVQHDSLSLDADESVRRAAAFHATFEDRIATEVRRLEVAGADLVVGDVPPLAFAAARRAGIPSIAIANFTWDWIYEAYEPERLGYRGLLPSIREAYRSATEAWRLPMHGGFEVFDRVADLPFVARRATRSPADVRRSLGLPADLRLVLLSFGGYGLQASDLPPADLAGWAVVMADTLNAPGPGGDGRRLFRLDERALYGRGLRYEDLVGAVDAVLTKPGFGIIAECLANDTALVYTSRGSFREYDVLVAEMPRYVRCCFLDRDDFLAGRWRDALDTALARPDPPERPPLDGAVVAADRIVAHLE